MIVNQMMMNHRWKSQEAIYLIIDQKRDTKDERQSLFSIKRVYFIKQQTLETCDLRNIPSTNMAILSGCISCICYPGVKRSF